MSRLTKKLNDDGWYEVEEYGPKYNEVKLDAYFDAVYKLGMLEDIEEQIGCPLEVVAKAITYGIAYELKNGLIESEPHISLTECGYGYILCSGSSTRKVIENGEFQTKDYKKTWWLKEDMSE